MVRRTIVTLALSRLNAFEVVPKREIQTTNSFLKTNRATFFLAGPNSSLMNYEKSPNENLSFLYGRLNAHRALRTTSLSISRCSKTLVCAF